MSDVAWFVLILGIIFVTEGEPDLWDKWKADLMKPSVTQQCTENSQAK